MSSTRTKSKKVRSNRSRAQTVVKYPTIASGSSVMLDPESLRGVTLFGIRQGVSVAEVLGVHRIINSGCTPNVELARTSPRDVGARNVRAMANTVRYHRGAGSSFHNSLCLNHRFGPCYRRQQFSQVARDSRSDKRSAGAKIFAQAWGRIIAGPVFRSLCRKNDRSGKYVGSFRVDSALQFSLSMPRRREYLS